MNLFWELHQELPREGPGDNASTRKAYSLLKNLSTQPRILDIGCGPGMQTIELAKISGGSIVGIDTHQPFLDDLIQKVNEAGLSDQVTAMNLSMFDLDAGKDNPFQPGAFDVLWSEGAIYIRGFGAGLSAWRYLLKSGGYVAVTELSWIKPNPPEEIQSYWKAEYPGAQTVEANLQTIQETGYREIGHFILPETSWYESYYDPLERRIALLAEKYQHDPEAQAFLRDCQREISLYRNFSEWYGYVFYVMQAEPDLF